MNINAYKEYRFTKIKLISKQSGRVYDLRLEKDDRFYVYLKPYIVAENVDNSVKLMVDDMIIEDINKTFFEEDAFAFQAIMLAKDKNDYVYGYEFSIENVRFNHLNVSKQKYENNYLICSLYEMVIPSHTKIELSERLD